MQYFWHRSIPLATNSRTRSLNVILKKKIVPLNLAVLLRMQFDHDERIRRFGIECGDGIEWSGGAWTPGGEFCKSLVLKNVGCETINLTYVPPATSFFTMDFPEEVTLSPGMQLKVQVVFRPVRLDVYDDFIKFKVRKKKLSWSFAIPTLARLSQIKVTMKEYEDFGFCPVNEVASRQFQFKNDGQVPVDFKWNVATPFEIQPVSGDVPAGKSITFTATYRPTEASVYVSKSFLDVSGISPLEFKLSGIGKYPFVAVSEENLSFGKCFTGTVQEKEIVLKNKGLVAATISVGAMEQEIRPLFTVSPSHCAIEPGQCVSLKVTYHPACTGQFSCEKFEFKTAGGNTVGLCCSGNAIGPMVKIGRIGSMGSNFVQFGETLIKGLDTEYHTKIIYLSNRSETSAKFQFMTDPNAEFCFPNGVYGEIGGRKEKAITVTFRPSSSANYYKRIICAIQDQMPVIFEMVGTAYSGSLNEKKKRPEPLLLEHVIKHKRRQILGTYCLRPETLLEVSNSLEADFKEEDVVSTCSGDATVGQHSVAEELFNRPFQYASADESCVDFGVCSRFRKCESKSITVKNTHQSKVTCTWSVNCEKNESPFEIFPKSQDIESGGSAEFRVHFRPSHDNVYYHATASSHVHLKSNRTFRLVNTNAFVPPCCVTVDLLAHTFQPDCEHFLPKIQVDSHGNKVGANKHSIDLPVCHAGESVYQTFCVRNSGNTPVKFEFTKNFTNSSFSVMPERGIILSNAFQLLTVKSNPLSVGPHEQVITCLFNNTTSHEFHLSCYCDVPGVEIAEIGTGRVMSTIYIKPVSCGQKTNRMFKVQNTSRVPLQFEFKVPKRFQTVLSVTPSSGQVMPLQSQEVHWTFAPTSVSRYDMNVVLFARSISDSPIALERRFEVNLISQSTEKCLRMEQTEVSMGTVLPNTSSQNHFSLANDSDGDVPFEFHVAAGDVPEFLKLSITSGVIPARSALKVDLLFEPTVCGNYEFTVTCNESMKILILGTATNPTIAIEDARCSEIATSSIWNQFEIESFNQILNTTETMAQDLVEMRFTPGFLESPQQVISLQFKNPGDLPVEFRFKFPNESDIEIEDWADESEPSKEEMQVASLINDNIVDIQPRKGMLLAGEACCVRFSYKYESRLCEGDHQVEVLLAIKNGKKVPLRLSGKTLVSEEPYIFVNNCRLMSLPLGIVFPPVQQVELVNYSNSVLEYDVDMDSINQLCINNYDYPVLSCSNPTGTIQAGQSHFLDLIFSPVEDKQYECVVIVRYNGDRCTQFRLTTGQAIRPPTQQLLAVPHQLASVSTDSVDFGTAVVGGLVSRISIIRNLSAGSLQFYWNQVIPGLTIRPSSGTIAPGSFVICKFTYTSDSPCILSRTIQCLLETIGNTENSDCLSKNSRSESRASTIRPRVKNAKKAYQSVVHRSTACRDQRLKLDGTFTAIQAEETEEKSVEQCSTSGQKMFLKLYAATFSKEDKTTDSFIRRNHDDRVDAMIEGRNPKLTLDTIDIGKIVKHPSLLSSIAPIKPMFIDFLAAPCQPRSKMVLRNEIIQLAEFQTLAESTVENTVLNLIQEALHGEIDLFKPSTLLYKK